jgi:SdrD B-like domain/IPTL-CTERM motif
VVFMDANNDGIQGPGELGIANVALRLLNAAGAVMSTTTTDANGFYLFSGLTAGTYIVEVVASNFVGAGPLVSMTSSVPTVAPLGLSAVVVDANRDVGINAAAPAMVGVRSAPVTLGPGLQPTGETLLSASVGQGTFDANANMSVDFGFIPAVKLGNLTWIDNGVGGGTANDGIQNGTELGLNGVTVIVRDSGGVVQGTAVTMNNPVTGLPGWYEFTLPPGSYLVEFVAPQGYTFTRQGTSAVTGTSGTDTSNSQPTLANPRTVVVNLPAGGNVNLQLDAGFIDAPTGVPTLSQWSLAVLAFLILLLAGAPLRLRRKM